MIELLVLRNFQSHKKTELILHPNINAIIGSSNSGKTAILRGLYWIVYNRPSGLSFISHWNRDKKNAPIKATSVCVTKNKVNITRLRSPEINGYYIEDDHNNPIKLEAIGMDVPDEVTKLLNLGEVNVQKQMDAPFLLSESAGEVARFFNKEIRLDLIDTILGSAESRRRQYNSEIKQTEISINAIEKELTQYDILPDAVLLCQRLKVVQEAFEKTDGQLAIARNTYNEYTEQEKIIATYATINFEMIEKLFAELEKIKLEEIRINETIDSINDKVEERQNFIASIASEKAILEQLEKELPEQCPLCGAKMEGVICPE